MIAYFLYIECARACGGAKKKAAALAANNVNFLALSKLWVADALGILNKSIRGI